MARFQDEFDSQAELMTILVTGEVQPGEMTDYARSVFKPRPRRVLWDMRAANWRVESVRQLAETLQQTREVTTENSRAAIVFGRNVDFGMGRVVESIAESREFPTEYRSFSDLESARAWLMQD